MNKVLKYTSPISTMAVGVTIRVPFNAILLKVAQQRDQLAFWYNVPYDTEPWEMDFRERKFKVFGTGWGIEKADDLLYFDTIFVGDEVYHIFEGL